MFPTVTKRQRLAAAEYLFGGDRVRPTQAELAKRWGISQQAVSARISRFQRSLSAEQRERFLAALRRARPGRKVRLVPMQLNLADDV